MQNDALATYMKPDAPEGDLDEALMVKRIYGCGYFSFLVLFIIYLVQVILLATFLNGGGSDIQFFAASISPVFIIALLFFANACGLIIAPVAIISLKARAREVLVFIFFSHFVLIPLMLATFLLLILRGNGVVALDSQNDSGDQDFFSPNVNFREFSLETVERIIEFTQDSDNADVWLQLQEDNNQCCGLNVESIYAADILGLNDFNRAELLSSPQCETAGAIDSLLAAFPTFDEDTQEAIEEFVDADPTLSDRTFFCERALSADVKDLAQTGGVLYGVTMFLQLGALGCVAAILFIYDKSVGGLKNAEIELGAKAGVENTAVAQAGFGDQPTKNTGRRAPAARASRPLKFN